MSAHSKWGNTVLPGLEGQVGAHPYRSCSQPLCCAVLILMKECMLHRALLAAHPEQERALAEELDRAGLLAAPANPTPRPMNFADLARLTYLDGVWKLIDSLSADWDAP